VAVLWLVPDRRIEVVAMMPEGQLTDACVARSARSVVRDGRGCRRTPIPRWRA
jgi:hypothetical protein